jgi:hypothetical protein
MAYCRNAVATKAGRSNRHHIVVVIRTTPRVLEWTNDTVAAFGQQRHTVHDRARIPDDRLCLHNWDTVRYIPQHNTVEYAIAPGAVVETFAFVDANRNTPSSNEAIQLNVPTVVVLTQDNNPHDLPRGYDSRYIDTMVETTEIELRKNDVSQQQCRRKEILDVPKSLWNERPDGCC